jgi:hypothetical protein
MGKITEAKKASSGLLENFAETAERVAAKG